MYTKPKPIAIIVRALRALTLRAITLALVLDRYQGKAPWPAVLAALLCSVIGGYLVTRLAHVRELAIGALAGLLMLLVGAVATRLAPSISPPDNLLILIWTGGGALGGWLTRVRLSWIGREYERLRQRCYCIHHSHIGKRMTMITKMFKGNKMKRGKTMRLIVIPCALVLVLTASLLVGCSSQSNTSETLQVNIVEHTNDCFGSEEESTTAIWDDNDILVTTVVKTSVPCYAVKSIEAKQVESHIVVDISFERGEGICIECVGSQKLSYRILSPSVEVTNLDVDIDIDGQKVKQTATVAASEQVYALAVSPGEWLEYEIVSARNFTLRSSIQVGGRIRYEIVDTKTGQKVSLDGKIVILHEVPICDLYVNGEKVAEQVEQGILFPADVQFWRDYEAIELNWEKEASKMGRAYESEVRIESDRILFEYSLDITSWTRISTDRGTGIVLDLERVVDMQGNEASYHFVLADTSVMGVRL